MIYIKTNERQLDLVERIAKGETLKEAGNAHGITVERVRQIVRKFCREYLDKAHREGSVEHFYPGQDHEYNGHWSDAYDEYRHPDPTMRIQYLRRTMNKIGLTVDLGTTSRRNVLENLDEIRDQKDYWLHQIRLLRQTRSHPKPVYQNKR